MKRSVALVIQNSPLGEFKANLDRSLETIDEVAGLGADFVVFPEMNLTGYAGAAKIRDHARCPDADWTESLTKASEDHNLVILAGLAEKDDQGRIFATHLVFSPGEKIGRYRKIHLAPPERGVYTQGSEMPVFKGKGLAFGIQLCYDAHFPELSAAMALSQADVIFMPHASPRGTAEDKKVSWMRHLTARAFDNGLFVAAVNQCGNNRGGLEFPGVALLIGPDGYLAAEHAKGGPAILMAEIDTDAIDHVRSHKMRYFLPNRREDLY